MTWQNKQKTPASRMKQNLIETCDSNIWLGLTTTYQNILAHQNSILNCYLVIKCYFSRDSLDLFLHSAIHTMAITFCRLSARRKAMN